MKKEGLKILVATDAHRDLPSGVRTFNEKVGKLAEDQGHEMVLFDTFDANYMPDPTGTAYYVALPSKRKFGKFYEEVQPDAVHIATEGLVGYSARAYCVQNKIPFTAAHHTNMEFMFKQTLGIPAPLVWKYLRWFYRPAKKIHVSTPRLKALLQDKGITGEIVQVGLGVDRGQYFFDQGHTSLQKYPRPFFITMGRFGKEKNFEDYLRLDLPGTKFIVGDGPLKETFVKKYGKKVVFLPFENVKEYLSQADVFVYPSHFETFGMVMIEAGACGLPVAAYPVMGPLDIIEQGVNGFTYSDLKRAALSCLSLNKNDCIHASEKYTWETATQQFLQNLYPS